jgi:hypothetical protein
VIKIILIVTLQYKLNIPQRNNAVRCLDFLEGVAEVLTFYRVWLSDSFFPYIAFSIFIFPRLVEICFNRTNMKPALRLPRDCCQFQCLGRHHQDR